MIEVVKTVRLVAGFKSDDTPVFELVQVVDDPRGLRVVLTPGMVLGIAAADIIVVNGSEFQVVHHSGNLAVWLFAESFPAPLRAEIVEALSSLDGRLDGEMKLKGQAVGLTFRIHYSHGFSKIKEALDDLVRRQPELEWYFGNVYDPADGETPLGWWNDL